MGKRKVGSATNPRTVLVRVSSAHANRVASFIESIIKVARVPYSDSPRFPGVRIYCRTRIICSSTGIGCVGSWLTHGMLVTVEAMGLPPFPALVCHLFVCIALFACFCQSTCLLHPLASLGSTTKTDIG
jgi:hypothetical protein